MMLTDDQIRAKLRELVEDAESQGAPSVAYDRLRGFCWAYCLPIARLALNSTPEDAT